MVVDGAAPEGELREKKGRKRNAKSFESIGDVRRRRARVRVFGLLLG